MSKTLPEEARAEFLDGFVHCSKDPYMWVMTEKNAQLITLRL